MASARDLPDFHCDELGLDVHSIQRSLANRLIYGVGKDVITASRRDWFLALAYSVRERLTQRWMATMRSYYDQDVKRVYYFSLEFLIGRSLSNSILNLGFQSTCREALSAWDINYESLTEIEEDAALGNGGLGRLAACFLDSMATLALPGFGYGIRYEYGMFHQSIEDGQQVERPDNWLRYGNPWEYPRPEVLYPVQFNGRVVQYRDEHGIERFHWVDTVHVMAMAYDTPIPGYCNDTVNNMRLWSAKASRDFDLQCFNAGNYIKAVEGKNESENLSKVLYPDDSTAVGRELRFKQQYFFVSASLQDILFRFQKFHSNWGELPDKVAIQLNDTHPCIAIPELMRLLLDIYNTPWERAWSISTKVFSYTNHTLLPEALETWPVPLFERVLPRHLQIIYEINHRFLQQVIHRHPGDMQLVSRLSLVEEGQPRRIRMAHLAIVGSHKVNGVAQLHTDLMKSTIFRDFDQFWPAKIVNKTNGITQRRWLNQANPLLSEFITARIGSEWIKDLSQLRRLLDYAEDPSFIEQFYKVKRKNKQRLAWLIENRLGLKVNVDSLFDVQIKRIHEYKRQLLNLLHVLVLYNHMRKGDQSLASRTVIFSGKAAPGYFRAKVIIRLINDVADVVNNDPSVANRLKIVFIPNYDVSTALDIIPAADLSEQISTAGMEASGTGNMKLALNGALTIGTLDGANIEICDEVGKDNIFIFGQTAEQVAQTKAAGYRPRSCYEQDAQLRAVLDMIHDGFFSPNESGRYAEFIDSLVDGEDPFLVLADFPAYIECQEQVGRAFQDPSSWARKALINVANMGKFSSDRTILEYAQEIWQVQPIVAGEHP